MTLLNQLQNILPFFHILSWKDLIEIGLFSTITYKIAVWLAADRTKNLAPLFFGYILCTLCTWIFDFYSLNIFLLTYGPISAMIGILLHQETLQKNYVTLKRIIPAKETTHINWTQILIRSCLQASNRQQTIKIIIEQNDSLAELISSPFVLKTPIDQNILNLFIESPSYDQNQMLWLTHDGTLMGINTTWNTNSDPTWISDQIKDRNDKWFTAALIHTKKTDALACVCSGQTGLFTIIAQGKIVENLTGARALGIIKKYLHQVDITNEKGDNNNAHYDQKSFINQPNP